MILQNEVECHQCGSRIYSAHRHDFKSCECGSISVDGGMDYLRRVGDISGYEELSIEMPKDIVKACCNAIDHAIADEKNALGILCAVMRTINNMKFLYTLEEEDV